MLVMITSSDTSKKDSKALHEVIVAYPHSLAMCQYQDSLWIIKLDQDLHDPVNSLKRYVNTNWGTDDDRPRYLINELTPQNTGWHVSEFWDFIKKHEDKPPEPQEETTAEKQPLKKLIKRKLGWKRNKNVTCDTQEAQPDEPVFEDIVIPNNPKRPKPDQDTAVTKKKGDNDKPDPDDFIVRDAKDLDALDLDEETRASITDYFGRVAFYEAAAAQDIILPDSHQNAIISGKSGVGKSTLAKAMGLKMMADRPEDTPFYFVKPAQVIGRWRGHSQSTMRDLLEMAKDGVIIFDEIDTFLDIDSDDRMVLNVLNTHLGDVPNHPIVLATLYEHNRHRFQSFNTGMQSRFPSVINVPEQDAAKLGTIFTNAVAASGMPYDPAVTEAVESLIQEIKHAQRENFGHIREIDNIMAKTLVNMARRREADPENFTFEVTLDDIPVRDRRTGTLTPREAAAVQAHTNATHTEITVPEDQGVVRFPGLDKK